MIYSAFLESPSRIKNTIKNTTNSGSGVPLDEAFDKEYNKSARGPPGIIRYSRRKESVLKWNIIHQEKRQFTGFLYDICCLNDECSFHNEISDATTEADGICVSQLVNYISQ